MSTSRYFDRICVVILVLALIVTVLFMNGQSIGIELLVDADSEAHSDSEYFTENDQLQAWDTSSATYITLNGDSVSISGSNAYEYDGGVVISGSGKYVLTGTLDDGCVTVNANANSKVWILLDNVSISCSDNACLRVDEADKVFLTLAEGTVNKLTGGGELSEEASQDGTYGVIFAHDDLTINGSGALQIHAGYRHGIKANDDLVITGGTIGIEAAADGIHVNDSFRLKDASVSITAGDDGILTENAESYFYLESGEITINAEGDGIHSSGDVILAGGTITMDAGDDGIHADGNVDIQDGVIQMNSCYEGIEGTVITVSGGDITIYPEDDGFNASSGSTSEGGMFPGGGRNPRAAGSFEHGMQMPEGAESPGEGVMQMPEQPGTSAEGGMQMPEMPEASEGDGMQMPEMPEASAGDEMQMPEGTEAAADGRPDFGEREAGTDQTGQTQTASPGELQEDQQNAENYIRISGGTITIINENGNDADGLDSNGDIFITGGDIRISLTDSGSNSAIDAASENGCSVVISGGTVIACGSSSMAEAFDSTSEQCSIMYNIASGMDGGTYLAVEDADGTEILSWEVPCSFSSAVISSPDLQIAEAYTIAAGDGEETITLSEVSASFGDAQSTMFRGNMNWGGMQRRRGRSEDSEFSAESASGQSRAEIQESGASETSEAPEDGVGRPGFMQEGQGPAAMGTDVGGDAAALENSETAVSTVFSYDKNIWALTLVSLLVLSAGLIIAKKYKRR